MADKGGGGYDPYENRAVALPLTNFEALTSLLRCVIGTGVLAMPDGIKNSGYVNGFIGTCIFGFFVGLAITLLVKGRYIVCSRQGVPILSYNETISLGMGYGPPCFRACSGMTSIFVDIFLFLYYYGTCCVYIVFMAESVKQIIDFYFTIYWNVRIYMIIIGLPLLMIFMLRDLKKLVPFSTLANILMTVGFCGIFFYILRGLPSISERPAFQSWHRYPLFVGTVLFGIQSVGVMLAIEANMANPKDYIGWTGILSIGMLVITVLYALIGCCGFWRYGDSVMGSITLNIPKDEIIPQIVKIMFAISIFFTYPLQGYVCIEVVYKNHIGKKVSEENYARGEYITRIIFVLITVFSAVAVPKIGLLLSFTGAVSISFVGLVFPAILDICVKYGIGYGPVGIWLIRDLFLVLLGIAGFFLGSTIAIHDIIVEYTGKEMF